MAGNGYKDLIVWQKAVDLVVQVYKITESFPQSEIFGLTSQMRRAAVSIPANISEGSKRSTKKDFAHFIAIALGSGGELETHIEIVKRLSFGAKLNYTSIDMLLDEVMKMLTKLRHSLN